MKAVCRVAASFSSDTTPTAYLRRVRLDRAHEHLTAARPGDGVTVSEVAAPLGLRRPPAGDAVVHHPAVPRSLLTGTGVAICGASAIAVVGVGQPVVGGARSTGLAGSTWHTSFR